MKKIIFPIAAAVLIGSSAHGEQLNQAQMQQAVNTIRQTAMQFLSLNKKIDLKKLEHDLVNLGQDISNKKPRLQRMIGEKNAALAFGTYQMLAEFHNALKPRINWLNWILIHPIVANAYKFLNQLKSIHPDFDPKKNKYLTPLK